MFWTFLALLLWIVLGGFISYYGDLQGRRWGKKRVSWFGMRPKHTAILITSLTGAFIALFSIISLCAIVPTVRDVILRGENAIRENERLNTDLAQQQTTFKTRTRQAQAELTQTRTDFSQSKLNVSVLNGQLTALKKVRDSLAKQTQEKQNQNIALKQQEGTLTQSLATENRKHNQLVISMHDLAAQIHRLAFAKSQLTRLNRSLAQDNKTLNKENRLASIANTAIGKQNLSLEARNSDLESHNLDLLHDIQLTEINKKILEKQKVDLLHDNEALERVNTNLVSTNGDLFNNNQKLIDDNSALTSQKEQLLDRLVSLEQVYRQSYSGLRQSKLNLRAGTEVARRVIDAHTRPEAVQAELQSLLKDANATALSYGAARGENGMAAQILDGRTSTAGGSDQNARLEALARDLAGKDVPVVIVATTVDNVMEGEQALVELHPYQVATIFEKGALIASRQINARQNVGRVFEAIIAFLQQDVRDAAIKAGTIPHIDPETGSRQVGSLGTADLVALTDQVRRMGGDVELRAIAAAPMTSADYPLHLKFELKRRPRLVPPPDAFPKSAPDDVSQAQ